MEFERDIDETKGVVITRLRGHLEIASALELMRDIPSSIPSGSPWRRRIIDLSEVDTDAEDEVLWSTLAGGLRFRSDESGTHAVAVVAPPELIDPLRALAAHHFGDAATRLSICSALDEALSVVGDSDADSA